MIAILAAVMIAWTPVQSDELAYYDLRWATTAALVQQLETSESLGTTMNCDVTVNVPRKATWVAVYSVSTNGTHSTASMPLMVVEPSQTVSISGR